MLREKVAHLFHGGRLVTRRKLVILVNTCKSWYNQELWAHSTKRRKNPFRHAYVCNGLPRLDMLHSCHACRRTDDSLARVIDLPHPFLLGLGSFLLSCWSPGAMHGQQASISTIVFTLPQTFCRPPNWSPASIPTVATLGSKMCLIIVTAPSPRRQAQRFPSWNMGRQLLHPCITWKCGPQIKRDHKGSKGLDHAPKHAFCWAVVPSSLPLASALTSKTFSNPLHCTLQAWQQSQLWGECSTIWPVPQMIQA